MRERLEDDPREHDGLVGLSLDAAGERGELSHRNILGHALSVLKGPVLAPHPARLARDAPVGVELALGDGEDVSVDVMGHQSSPSGEEIAGPGSALSMKTAQAARSHRWSRGRAPDYSSRGVMRKIDTTSACLASG